MILQSSLLPPTKAGCLAAAIATSLQGGSLYLLGVWAGQLKRLLGLSQTQSNAIATALFFGGCVATPLTNALFHKTKYHPWSIVLLLGALGSGGYMIFWAACKSLIPVSSAFVPLLIGSALIGNNIMTLFIMALVTAVTHLQPSSKQSYQAVMQGFFAIGNICWPLIAQAIYQRSYSLAQYLPILFLVLAITTFGLALVCVIFLHPAPPHENTSVRSTLITPPAAEDLTTRELFQRTITLEFSAVVALNFIGLGLTANVLSNASSMISSAAGAMAVPPNPFYLMMEFGFAQAIGRILCIAWLFFYNDPPLPYVPLVLAFLLMVVAFICALLLTSALFVRLEFLLTGVAYGLIWSSFSAVVMKLVKFIARTPAEEKALMSFGIAVSYVIAPAFGPLLCGLLAGYIYDSYGWRSHPTADTICYGVNCYRLTFILSLVLSGAGLVGATALHIKDWRRRHRK